MVALGCLHENPVVIGCQLAMQEMKPGVLIFCPDCGKSAVALMGELPNSATAKGLGHFLRLKLGAPLVA